MARILLAGVKIPFVRGGQDVLMNSLERELNKRGHETDRIELPHTPRPKERILQEIAVWRSLEVREAGGQPVDLVIATKFPTYFLRHPKKSIWMVHQHREIYDLNLSDFSGFSDGVADQELRSLLIEADNKAIGEAAFISGISKTVVDRIKKYNQIDAVPLYPPLPLGDTYQSGPYGDYILSVARVCAIKRIDYAVKALPFIAPPTTLKIVGSQDDKPYVDHLKAVIEKHNLGSRVEFLGRVSDDELRSLYANAGAVFYSPQNEDYGYVTLEAFASGKPVITAPDSGGVLEFVEHEATGLIVGGSDAERGAAITRLMRDKTLAERLGRTARSRVEELGLLQTGWDAVVDGLLSPLGDASSGKVK